MFWRGVYNESVQRSSRIPLSPYIVRVLVNWSTEREQKPGSADDSSVVMAPIAQSLTKPQIEAVAAYLSHLD
jgi:cytochrome c553